MTFESLIRYKALHQGDASHGFLASPGDRLDERLPDPTSAVDIALFVSCDDLDRIESICATLGLGREEFFDAAIKRAIAGAQEIMSEVGCTTDRP